MTLDVKKLHPNELPEVATDTILIDITGRPSSGKTTIAYLISQLLKSVAPDKPVVVHSDDFNVAIHDMPDNGEVNDRIKHATSFTIVDSGSRHRKPLKLKDSTPSDNPTSDAVNVVINALRTDPEYAWTWQCNIAGAFWDSWYLGEKKPPDLHERTNRAAARFLRQFANINICDHDEWKAFQRTWDEQRAAGAYDAKLALNVEDEKVLDSLANALVWANASTALRELIIKQAMVVANNLAYGLSFATLDDLAPGQQVFIDANGTFAIGIEKIGLELKTAGQDSEHRWVVLNDKHFFTVFESQIQGLYVRRKTA